MKKAKKVAKKTAAKKAAKKVAPKGRTTAAVPKKARKSAAPKAKVKPAKKATARRVSLQDDAAQSNGVQGEGGGTSEEDRPRRPRRPPRPQEGVGPGTPVNVVKGKIPADYHCRCDYCKKYLGELRPADGTYYNRLERRRYYAEEEKGKGGHIAKTPLHIARFAIQHYTKEGDWVIDPTIGAGTTAVEAITQKRNVAGMELEFGRIVKANVKAALAINPDAKVLFAEGDARNIGAFLKENAGKVKFDLAVNNPPYSGDVSMPSPKGKLRGKEHRHLETHFVYDKTLPNLAFLKEGQEYWDTIGAIYKATIDRLKPGAPFVIGVKDMMRKQKPFLLHKMLCDLMVGLGMQFVGTFLLKHYPGTLFLNTYEKFYGVKPPLYQTISVFANPG